MTPTIRNCFWNAETAAAILPEFDVDFDSHIQNLAFQPVEDVLKLVADLVDRVASAGYIRPDDPRISVRFDSTDEKTVLLVDAMEQMKVVVAEIER